MLRPCWDHPRFQLLIYQKKVTRLQKRAFIEMFKTSICHIFLYIFVKVALINTPRDTYRKMITNGNYRHHNIRHTIRICGVNMVNDRRRMMCNTRWFSNQLGKTVFAVESGPFQIATCSIGGKRYIKVFEYEYFWKLIDSRSKLVSGVRCLESGGLYTKLIKNGFVLVKLICIHIDSIVFSRSKRLV